MREYHLVEYQGFLRKLDTGHQQRRVCLKWYVNEGSITVHAICIGRDSTSVWRPSRFYRHCAGNKRYGNNILWPSRNPR